MLYCEKCHYLSKNETCSNCGDKKLRIVDDEDYYFLIEKEMIWAEMLKEILEKNNIDFISSPVLGAGITTKIGIASETYQFYVRYAQYKEAQKLIEMMFNTQES